MQFFGNQMERVRGVVLVNLAGLGFRIAYICFCFLFLTAMEGLWSVFGEFELAHYGVSREQMVLSLCVGSAAALFVGSFLGVLSDIM
jgi:uncharacterized metal-binding protein